MRRKRYDIRYNSVECVYRHFFNEYKRYDEIRDVSYGTGGFRFRYRSITKKSNGYKRYSYSPFVIINKNYE